MRNDLHNLRHEALVRRNLRIPRLHILLQDDRQERVQLQIDVVAARQRREQFLDRPALVSGLLGAQRPPDEGLGGRVGEVVGHGAGGAAVRRGRRGGVRFRGRGWLGRRGRVRGRRGHLDRGPGRVRPRGGGRRLSWRAEGGVYVAMPRPTGWSGGSGDAVRALLSLEAAGRGDGVTRSRESCGAKSWGRLLAARDIS